RRSPAVATLVQPDRGVLPLHPEGPMTQLQRIDIRQHALQKDPDWIYVSPGQSLRSMLLEVVAGKTLADDLVVRVGGAALPGAAGAPADPEKWGPEVPRHMWARVRPKRGTAILVYRRSAVQGGSARQII